MEAIESFGGSSLSNVLSNATRRVARTLDPTPAAKKGKEGVAEDVSCDTAGESCDEGVEKENTAAVM